jgi:hypothetical protein
MVTLGPPWAPGHGVNVTSVASRELFARHKQWVGGGEHQKKFVYIFSMLLLCFFLHSHPNANSRTTNFFMNIYLFFIYLFSSIFCFTQVAEWQPWRIAKHAGLRAFFPARAACAAHQGQPEKSAGRERERSW